MSITGTRVESILVEHLTKSESSRGYLDGISGGDLTWNANADLPSGGYVALRTIDQNINFSQDRFRIWWVVEGEDPWPRGVFVISSPETDYEEDGSSRQVSLIDKVTVVRDDVLLETLTISAGTNTVQAMVAQIQATGETRIAATASSHTLTNDMSWQAGVSRIRVINDLATAAGYWSLWTDDLGQFRVEPYIAPADRNTSYQFIEGETSIHEPEWQHSMPLWEATNTVVLVSQEDDNGNVFFASAVDDNPRSPTSTVSMGRVLNPIVEENVEAASQLDLQVQANRKLIDNSNVVGRINMQHRPIRVWYNESVTFVSQGIDTRATITKMSLRLEPGSLVQTELRQI